MNHKELLTNSFQIGVKYCQHRDMKEEYWDTDFANMRDCGIDVLRIHAFWAPIEPKEGVFDFAQYDRITKKAGEYGIKIMFTLYLMSAPEWIFHKHPDSRFVSANGTVWNSNQFPDNSHGGWPGLCFDSKPFRQTVENFVSVFVERYKDNENVMAIDIWHEPTDEPVQQYGQNNWKELFFCYCEHSVEGFREWLRRKYGSLNGLNKVWTRHYNNWSEVEPPRNYGTFTDWIDWRTYRIEAVADSVGWLNSIVKKYDNDRSTSVHLGIFELGHPVTSCNDHFKFAHLTDMFACSMYDTINPDIGGFTCDLMRSACDNKSYWIGETETGSGPMFVFLGEEPEHYHCFSRPADSKEIFNLTWSSIARGAKGVFFWGWRPDISTMETLSLGFTERNGDLTERTDALKRFTKVFRKYRAELAAAFAPSSDVCILYNMDSVLLEGLVSLSQAVKKSTVLKERYYKDMLSFIGCYRLLMKNGIQPDFVSKDEVDAGGLSGYKLLILPYSISICEKTASSIEKFVKNGGKVISDAMLGFFTDEAWGSEVCPPHGLDEVFGLNTKSNYELIKHCGMDTEKYKYNNVGRMIRERINVLDGASIQGTFENGRPAFITNSYGKGMTAYLGMMFFANVVVSDMNESNILFNELLKQVDYKKDKIILNVSENNYVEVRRLIGHDSEFVFVINHSKENEHPFIRLYLEKCGNISEIISGLDVSDLVEDNYVTIEEEFGPYEVKIYRILY